MGLVEPISISPRNLPPGPGLELVGLLCLFSLLTTERQKVSYFVL